MEKAACYIASALIAVLDVDADRTAADGADGPFAGMRQVEVDVRLFGKIRLAALRDRDLERMLRVGKQALYHIFEQQRRREALLAALAVQLVDRIEPFLCEQHALRNVLRVKGGDFCRKNRSHVQYPPGNGNIRPAKS